MPWRMLASFVLLVSHMLACLLLGALLVIRGVRGRYVGEEPRCKSCTYQLTGRLDAERCPECGTKLSRDTIVHGLRRPRWGLLVAAIVATPILWWSSRDFFWNLAYVDWYRYYPTGMILRDAEADRFDGIAELERRILKRSLSETECEIVADLALKRLDQWASLARATAWSRVLESMDRRGALTDEHRDRLWPLLAPRASLTVRPVVRAGDPIVLRLDFRSLRSGIHQHRFWHEPTEVQVGRVEIFKGAGNSWRRREPDWRADCWDPVPALTTVFPSADVPTGVVRLEYAGRHIFLDPAVNSSTGDPSWSSDIRLKGTVEIVPGDASDPVAWLAAPDAQAHLLDTMGVYLLDNRWESVWPMETDGRNVEAATLELDGDQEILDLEIVFLAPAPVPVAFDLVVEASGAELPTDFAVLGEWYVEFESCVLAWRADGAGTSWVNARVPRFTADEIFIILRGSRDVARRTIDIFEVWQGELRFGPFRVEHALP